MTASEARETLAAWKAQAERDGIPWKPFEDAMRKLARGRQCRTVPVSPPNLETPDYG